MLFDVERLRPERAVDTEIGQSGVDFRLILPSARPAAQGLPEVLPPMSVQVAEERPPTRKIADPSSLVGVRFDQHDRRIDLRPRPEVAWGDAPNHAHVRD